MTQSEDAASPVSSGETPTVAATTPDPRRYFESRERHGGTGGCEVVSDAHDDEARDPLGLGTSHGRVRPFGKVLCVEVAMRVDEARLHDAGS